jgi:hypothetical protein
VEGAEAGGPAAEAGEAEAAGGEDLAAVEAVPREEPAAAYGSGPGPGRVRAGSVHE